MHTRTNFIFVTGGVISSVGKGITTAALGALLQANGFKVRLRKLEPYINIDAGTMNPYQHGEVFVTEDGAETDLDLGHYERFSGINSSSHDIVTTGAIYTKVLERERQGSYLGETIQVIPHVTDAIKQFIYNNLEDEDFVIYEIGGTVGDIESLPYLEAIRQVRNDRGHNKVMFIHLALLVHINAAGEMKTKPTQHSVKELLSIGIQPDVLICRCDQPISEEIRNKLSLFCNISRNRIIEARDVDHIYNVPLNYHQHKLDKVIIDYFQLNTPRAPDLSRWHTISLQLKAASTPKTIAIVGKYVALLDAYKSLNEALQHSAFTQQIKLTLLWLDAENYNIEELKKADGIIVPGGFGERGVQGKISAIKYARENKVPFLGICFGMQIAIIEAARNLLNLPEASSTEFGPTKHPVIALMTEWIKGEILYKREHNGRLGGTMRLGSYPCRLMPNSLAHQVYNQDLIFERHRHRYEVNFEYRELFEKVGLRFSGTSPDGVLPEIIEYADHPWFIGVQFHPELKSRPFEPHPLFNAFIAAT